VISPSVIVRFPLRFIIVVFAFAGAACRVREAPDDARAKVQKEFLEKQIASLEELLAKARRGELVTTDQIAISIDEGVAREILNAPLPQEQLVGGHARIRIESAEPFFRGNQAGLLFKARVTTPDLEGAFAELELGGGLSELKLVDGRLQARVSLVHFTVMKASVGPLAQGLVEGLVRSNLAAIQEAIPPFEVPVRLDQRIAVPSFEEGPVAAGGGELPLSAEVSQVLQNNKRLWVLIDSKAGPWKPAAKGEARK
jgi:hypothetical protein